MKIEILDLAKEDLIEAYFFYEEQESGLGDYFLLNLYADIELLTMFFGIHRKVYKKILPLPVKKISIYNLLYYSR